MRLTKYVLYYFNQIYLCLTKLKYNNKNSVSLKNEISYTVILSIREINALVSYK